MSSQAAKLTRRQGVLLGRATVVATVLAVGTAGTAYAYWATTGTGSGSGSATAPSPLTTIDATGSTSGLLVPGGSAALVVNVSNPNSYSVTVTSVAPNGTPSASCTTPALTVATSSGLTTVIGANSTSPLTLAGAVQMGASSSDCQGATFTIPVTVTGRK